MRLYLISILICTVGIILPHNIIASDTDYYIKILKYGTDSDIENAFNGVYEDQGDAVNEAVFGSFEGPHSDKMMMSLVRYLSIVSADTPGGQAALRTAQILNKEMTREGVTVDYLEEVIYAAGEAKAKSCVKTMTGIFQNKKTQKRIRLAVVDAWGKIRDMSVEDVLLNVLRDDYEDTEMKARAIRALGEMESAASVDILEKTVKNTYEPKLLRMYAVLALSKIGKESALDILEEVIYDKNHEVAEYAVRGIAELNCDRCGEVLIKALRSDYDKVRYYAVIGLSRLRYTDSVEILQFKAEYDANERVREEAKKAVELLTEDGKGDNH